MNLIAILQYTTLLLLASVVLSVFAIAGELKKKGYVKSRLYLFDPFPYIEGSKKLFREGDANIRFWINLLIISCVILIPLSLLELLL